MSRLAATAGIMALAARLARGSLAPRRRLTLRERLHNVPIDDAPLVAPAAIHWNQHMVPFIDAADEPDLAVALGVVHGHLRLAQLEAMRRISQGRLAEVLGPAAVDADHVLRVLDLGRATPAMEAMLPDATRAWLEGFADGLNHVIAHVNRARRYRPEELALLGVAPQPWTVSDLLTLGRLAATDFTWKVWIRLLKLRGRPDWLKLWSRLMDVGGEPPVPALSGSGGADGGGLEALDWLCDTFGRPGGSNSVAVDAARGAGGAAKIASDPHLPITLPNLWLLVGMHCPTLHCVGYMVPGVPAVAIGRNPWIAWGGTSLHAASSELFDLSDLPDGAVRERRETIRVRWGADREVSIGETDWGPVLSDAPLIGPKRGEGDEPRPRFALRWVGHDPSDEITALLGVNRARDLGEFRAALEGFAIPAQNMIYADERGRIAQVMAAHLPKRPLTTPEDMLAPRSDLDQWRGGRVTGTDLPAVVEPAEGFVASANNRPEETPAVAVSWFFSPDDRVTRLRQLLAEGPPLTVGRLKALQADVTMPGALVLRDALLGLAPAKPEHEGIRRHLMDWTGTYDANSTGALAFELFVNAFAEALHGEEDLAIYTATWDPWALLRDDLERLGPDRLATAALAGLDRAGEGVRRHRAWGAVHRLRLSHVLGALPGIGRRWRFVDAPIAGSNETVMKTAHGFSGGPHAVRLGANARHVSDLADMDANWFVLMGGQDARPGSVCFLDQWDLWREGQMMHVPLRLESVRRDFPYRTTLRPPTGGG
ncbi:hypothetical protein C882_3854 [Caenispirillum salinarum AK4]|uniref:Penicillin acylase family protein n=1 Tax=Caenispirillum salinarum AK4 TaxID=1238182 RepID=K9HT53_9PROT|nr:penicillin acylase family protein [Caenispirillum salinarum]EKV31481.1 hypothetical protein C882_3854 [Caenispirillum salinarum AK4]